jgi:DNA-directed RNA polymerase subunit RPC12/RpoP
MKLLTPKAAQWIGHVTCSRCGAEMEVDGDDLRIEYGESDYQGPEWYCAYIDCMVCAQNITVKAPEQTLKILYWKSKGHPHLADAYFDK